MKTLLPLVAIIIISTGFLKAQNSAVSENTRDSVHNALPKMFTLGGKDATIIKSHNKLYAVNESAVVSVKFEWVSSFGLEAVNVAPQKIVYTMAMTLNDAAHPEAFKALKKHLKEVKPAVGNLMNYDK